MNWNTPTWNSFTGPDWYPVPQQTSPQQKQQEKSINSREKMEECINKAVSQDEKAAQIEYKRLFWDGITQHNINDTDPSRIDAQYKTLKNAYGREIANFLFGQLLLVSDDPAVKLAGFKRLSKAFDLGFKPAEVSLIKLFLNMMKDVENSALDISGKPSKNSSQQTPDKRELNAEERFLSTLNSDEKKAALQDKLLKAAAENIFSASPVKSVSPENGDSRKACLKKADAESLEKAVQDSLNKARLMKVNEESLKKTNELKKANEESLKKADVDIFTQTVENVLPKATDPTAHYLLGVLNLGLRKLIPNPDADKAFEHFIRAFTLNGEKWNDQWKITTIEAKKIYDQANELWDSRSILNSRESDAIALYTIAKTAGNADAAQALTKINTAQKGTEWFSFNLECETMLTQWSQANHVQQQILAATSTPAFLYNV